MQDDTGVCDRIEIYRRTSETGYLSNLKLWYEIGSFPCLIFVKCQGWHNSHIKQMEYVVQTQQRVIETDSGPHTLYLIKVPEESQAKLKWWCFIRQIEFLCCNTTKHSSNLLFDISQLELGHAVRQYKRQGDHGATPMQWKSLLVEFNKAKKEIDPLCGPGKQFAVLPLKVAATLALNRGNRALLEALGGDVPEAWIRADRIIENAAHGEVDGRDLLPEEEDEALDRELGEDELLANVIAAELAGDFGVDEEAQHRFVEEEEASLGRNYALEVPSKALKLQFKDMDKWRTSTLMMSRSRSAVVKVTFDSDRASFLRFLGWLNARPGAMEVPLDFTIFSHEHIASFIAEFATWCIETRELSYGSLASYLNSLLSCVQFTNATGLAFELAESLVDGLINLRAQASKRAKHDRMYQPRHKEWLSWEEAQSTRYSALKFMHESPPVNRWERINIQEMVVIICLLTTAPPDRVGVLRRLAFGRTLRKGGHTGWFIDLTAKNLHKTSRCE